MMTLNATGSTFFGPNTNVASFAFIDKFKSTQMNLTITSVSTKLFFLLFEQIVLHPSFNLTKECLILYYNSTKSNTKKRKRKNSNEEGNFEMIDLKFLHTPEIYTLYKLEEIFLKQSLHFERDMLFRCSKYKRGELVTDQIFIHLSLDDNFEIASKKKQYLLFQNNKTKYILSELFLPFMCDIVFKYVQQLDFCLS